MRPSGKKSSETAGGIIQATPSDPDGGRSRKAAGSSQACKIFKNKSKVPINVMVPLIMGREKEFENSCNPKTSPGPGSVGEKLWKTGRKQDLTDPGNFKGRVSRRRHNLPNETSAKMEIHRACLGA